MKAINISLKQSIILVLVVTFLLLIAGYSNLSASYFIGGMDNITMSNMAKAAHKELYPDNAAPDPLYFVSRTWEEQPSQVRSVMPEAPPQSGKLYKVQVENGDLVFGLHHLLPNDEAYVSFYLSQDAKSRTIRQNLEQNFERLVIISGVTVLMLGLLLGWLLKRISRPISALGEWSRGLNEKTLKDPVPDFTYSDLNDFAVLIQESLTSANESLIREEAFLRHASHELRTPISIIHNNIELLQCLREQQGETEDSPETPILLRMQRASATMKSLTETLLWLSKDLSSPLQEQEVRVDQMLEYVISEQRYLTAGNAINIKTSLEPWSGRFSSAALQIVLTNIVRNAFQHSFDGEVFISTQENKVVVTNPLCEETGNSPELGFGLGIELTKKLTEKLHWGYQYQIESNIFRVEIMFEKKC
ncbi:sensor histidine kinase [Alteromonas sp. a30]|uniref:sensor histidine kinase n=1 Tax=Alteromonas sp. a30 TaxID=2730917 RepID=UPI00227F6E2A|nr:HAMP domain-containing sensor histidine kinase [Alteromonas sp. a30]MCY7297187.1 HAMP domain-containing histidine kinase [Alteromonas sp. a30]